MVTLTGIKLTFAMIFIALPQVAVQGVISLFGG